MATSDSPLSVPDVTLTVARGASGGSIGSGPLIGTLLDGNTNQGSKVRLEPDGAFSFGTKPEGPAVLHDFGHTTYERGVENTFNQSIADGAEFSNSESDRIYDSVSGGATAETVLTSEASALRHSHASRAYQGIGNYTSLRRSREFLRDGKDAGHRTMLCAFWVKYSQNSLLMRAVSDETTTSTFIEDEILSTNNGEFIGRYSYFQADAFANLKHHLVIDNDRVPSDGELYGKVLTGQTSGATITFPSAENWSTAYTTVNGTEYPFVRRRGPKLGRWWDNPSGNTSGGNLDYVRCSVAVDDGYISTENGRPVSFGTDAFQPPGEWVLFELEFDLSENGFFRHRFNETLREETTFAGPVGDPNYSPEMSQIGIDGGWVSRQQVTFGEVYFDYTRHRVYLADAANWAGITHREYQRIESWASGEIVIALHKGALNSGWLYVVGADGEPVNTAGVEVT